MDIGALSIAMSQARVQQDIGIAVVKMAMDTGEDNASQMISEIMTNSAVDPNLGNNIDVSI